jgi:uncharacterized protein (DUF885 family)
MAAHPVWATLLGDHRFDTELGDLSESAEEALAADLARIDADAAAEPGELPLEARLHQGMLRALCDLAVTPARHRLTELTCDTMTGPHLVVLRDLPMVTLTADEHAEAHLERLTGAGALLDTALERLRAGVRRGRTPAAVNVRRVLSQLDAALATPVADDPLLRPEPPAHWNVERADRWWQRVADAVRDHVRPALERYRDGVAGEVAPAARSEDRAGLCWLEGGEEIYHELVRTQTSQPHEPRALHDSGRADLAGYLAEEYQRIAAPIVGSGELSEIFAALREDPAYRFAGPEEVREVATRTLDRAQQAAPAWFGRLPRTECVIAEMPAALAADSPMAMYIPPAADGSRPGTYWVNTHQAGELYRFEAESVGFHEAVPGHHLERALATELDGVPDFRRHTPTTAYVEGWGLYAERLADEMGLYASGLDRVGMLTADSWRTARLVVDTGLHALGWSRQQAVDFLLEQTPQPRGDIEVEVDRYIGMPAQALAYKVGQREIFAQRRAAEQRQGAHFDVAAFHEAVLGHGPLTLPLLAEVCAAELPG